MGLLDDIRASQQPSQLSLFDAIKADAGGKPDSGALRSIVTAPIPTSIEEAATRDNVPAPEDSWADIGRKFVSRIVPLVKQSIGGIGQAIVEGAAGPPTGAPLTSAEFEDMHARMEDGVKYARERNLIPGQALYKAASQDLAENGYNVGDSLTKKYGSMIAESMVQMVPAIAASIATRNPFAAGGITAGQVGGQQYGESRESGRARDASMMDATFMGASEAIGEQIPVGMLMKPGGKFLSRALKTAGAEGLQEMFTQVLQTGYDKGLLHPEMTWAEARQQVIDAGIVGAGMGVGMTAIEAPFHRADPAATAPIPDRPVAPGVREVAGATIDLTQGDVESPIPTDLIAKGKAVVATAGAAPAADAILDAAGMPKTGKRVTVTMPDGRAMPGVVADAFDTDAGELGRATGIKIAMDDGSQFAEHFDTINEAGVQIAETGSLAEADALDTALQEMAAKPLELPTITAPEAMAPTTPQPVANAGKGSPVADGGSVVRELFPDAHVTSTARSKDDPLSKANPKSWHARSNAAVDVRPIKGVSFDQFVQTFRDKGYSILEAKNEVGAGRSAWATGDHWHIVLGQGGTQQAQADVPAAAPESIIDAITASQAPESQGSDLRGEAIDKEWVRFAPETGTLDVPRAEMPQVAAEHRGALVNFLNARGIDHTEETVSADSLKPTQAEFSTQKVAKAKGFSGGDRAILVSSDGHVLDGHHQWIARRDAGEDVRTIKLNAPIRDLLKIVPEMPSATAESGATAAAEPTAETPVVRSEPPTQSLPPAEASAVSPSPTIEDMPSGKSVIIKGASEAQLAAVKAALPEKVLPLENKKLGGIVYSKKHEAKIKAALADVEQSSAAAARKTLRRPLTGPMPTNIDEALETLRQMRTAPKIDDYDSSRNHASHALSLLESEGIKRAADMAASTLSTDQRLNAHEQRAFEILRDAGEGETKPSLRPAPKAEPTVTPSPSREGRNVGAEEKPSPAPTTNPALAESFSPTDDSADVLAVVDANNQVRKAKEPYAQREAFRQGAAFQLGLISAEKAQPFVEAHGAEFRDGMSKAKAETRKRANRPESAQPTSAYGSTNKLVTADRADELRARLKAKMRNLNSGIDPEALAIGLELAVFHIEAGARKFADFVRAINADIADMGEDPAKMRSYLRAWYNGARDTMEDQGENVSDLDGPSEVRAAFAMLSEGDTTKTLAPAKPESEAQDGIQGSVSGSDAGASTADVQRASQDGRARPVREPESGGSQGDVRLPDSGRGEATERSGARSPDKARSRTTGSANADRVSGIRGTNWRIEPGSLDEKRSASVKARDNLKAIEIVKELDRDGRLATRDEQAAIARYVGWGGLKNAFPDTDGSYGKGFEEVGPRLRELLTNEEYDTARRSIQYAHYTSETIVSAMWGMARQFGFSGGLVFEPGMGTGNFAGLMPADIAAATQYQGIEYDHLTSRIAHHLYPQWGVRQADYTRQPTVRDTYDLVIGNPPFSETVITADPEYAGKGYALDAVRPGGVLMFVTSAGTMNKLGTRAREYLADRADLVGAVRLPGNAFEDNAGTSVTTDIVMLRKRLPGEAAGDRTWTETVERDLPNKDGGTKTGAVSRYFSEKPEMVLGEEGFFDTLVNGTRYAVRAPAGYDLRKGLADAAGRLPINVITARDTTLDRARADFDLDAKERKEGSFYVGDKGRLMQMRGGVGVPVEKPGKGVVGGVSAAAQERIAKLIPIRDALRAVYAHDLASNVAEGDKARASLNSHYDAFVKAFGPINKAEFSYRRPSVVQQETARAAMREEERLAGREWNEGSFDPSDMIERGASTTEIARARDDARKAAKENGRAWDEGTFDPGEMPDVVIDKRPNIDPFMDDQEGYRLRAIEHYNDDSGEAKKGLVFFENVITKERTPEINSAQDALLFSLNKLGRPDLALIAEKAGVSEAEALAQLADSVFPLPGRDGAYQTSAQYLSGNVRKKLDEAREEAKRDDRFERNVKALEAVQPTPLGPADIVANLGMPWIPTATIEEFGKHLGLTSLKVSYFPKLASWMAGGDQSSAASTTTWGTPNRYAPDLLSDALNRQNPKIYKEIQGPNGKERVLDATATQAAQDKVAEIKQAFREWIWTDETRTSALSAMYNREYNNLVAPVYDGSYLATPGIASTWSWRPHQTGVISRIIQSGNTYMAHEVGAGKTSAMIGAGMEMRRLGLVKKPAYAVPNHMLGQFTKEFYEQYPTARIAVADERRFHTARRKQFIANVASEDLDAVIITHSAFGFIPLSDTFTDSLVEEELSQYRDMLSEVPKGDQEARFTRRRIEQRIEQLEQRLSGKNNKKRDQVFSFEEMGVDFLFVDEAHLFRKLDFATKMGNIKGIDPSGSKMSFDLYAKVRYLETQKPGRSVVLASGTPITNTMAELFSVSRYLQMNELEERGLSQFDAWAGAFGDTNTQLEQDPAGGYKSVTRFSKFVNVPELSTMVRQVMDVVTGADLDQYVTRPKLKGGKRQMTVVEQTEGQKAYQASLAARMKAIQNRKGPPKKGDDILLSVIGDGRKNAIDYRLIESGAPKEATKLEAMIDSVEQIWRDTKRQPFHKITADGYSEKPVDFGPATQMIFSDFGINGDFQVQRYIAAELQRRGVPKGDVAVISDYKSHVAKQRLFNDMNDGKVRVLIGSVAKMGTGVNAQKRLYALHNMDAQWYPANDQQRNGRIVRQGNMNPEVEIRDYSTKGTYDSTMWGLMETKARFIEGFMRGDPTLRDMEDLGESSQYEQAKALTTSDPRIQTLTEWRQDHEKMIRRRSAFEREVQSVRSRISNAEYNKTEALERIPQIKADLAQRTDIAKDAFTGTSGGQVFTNREEFGEALMARMDEMAALPKAADLQPRKIGEMGGFDIVGDLYRAEQDTLVPRLYVRRNGGYETRIRDVTSARGLVTKISNVLSNFESELASAQDDVARAEARIAEYTPQLDRKFTGTAQMRELQAKITEMESTLEKESASNIVAVEGAGPKLSIPNEPVTVLTGDEVGIEFRGPEDYPALVKAAAAWYRKNLVGKTIIMADGVPVTFNTHGMRESTERRGDYLLRAIPAIPDILAKGELLGGAPGDRLGITKVSWVKALVRVADRDINVMLSVREHTDGKSRQYSLHAFGGVGGRFSQTEGATESGPDGKSPPTGFNIYLIDEHSNNADEEASGSWAGVYSDLTSRLKKLGIADRVMLMLNQQIADNPKIAGRYFNGVIEVALGSTQDNEMSLNHEAVHALRDLGLFLPAEWKTLESAALADKAMMDSVRRRYPTLTESEQIEEAVADRYARWAKGETERGFIATAFQRMYDFIRSLGQALRGQGFATADSVMRAIERGTLGTRDQVVGANAMVKAKQSVTFDNSETEARFQKAKDGVASTVTLKERVAEFLDTAWNGLSRHWIALPNLPKYAALQQKLRAIESAPQAAKERTVRMLEDIVKDFTPADLDLFTRKVILDDLSWDAANDRDLPFGLTPATVAIEKAKVDTVLQADPEQKVWKAAMKRKLANRVIANELVAAGVLEAEQMKNPAYYRHQVLEYARAEQKRAATASGTGSRLRSPRWAKRMGSTLDINANLLEAEFDWLNKALTDIPVAKTIEWIKRSEHNILDSLKTEAKESNKAGVDAALVKAQDDVANSLDPDEVARAAALIDEEKSFRQGIAMGFDVVRQAIESNQLKPPAQFENVADNIVTGRSNAGDPPFAFLSWILDSNEAGSMGAAMILKAIGQRRAWTQKLLGREFIDPNDAEELVKRLAPEGYRTWQPDEGKLLFTAKTLPEHAIDRMIEKLDAPDGIDAAEFRATLEKTRNALLVGGDRYQMILPEEVADTLSNLRRVDLEGLYDFLIQAPVRAWKRWVLINPRRFIKYNINNLTGDLDAILAGNPRSLRHVGAAAKELAAVMRGKQRPSERYQEAVARGVFDSGISIQEIPDLHAFAPFERFAQDGRRMDKLAMLPLRKAWNALQGATQWRENIFRYSAYLDYVERLESGEKQASIGYGASIPKMVDAVSDKKDRAALLARDLIGDYGAISHFGGGLRKTIIPFWSWMEINTRRYWRLTSNAYSQGVGKGIATGTLLGAAKGVRASTWMAVRAGMVYGLIQLWNNLFFDDEEDDLDEEQKRQLHIILGRNAAGEVITLRTQGAMSDALSWFGIGATVDAFKEYERGRGTLGEVLAQPFKAPINKIGTALSPALTLPLESATGKKLWPDLFNTRENRDPWRNVLGSFSLDNEYDWAMDKPSRGYIRSWQDAVVYRRDPGEIAYNEARGLAYGWLERVKGQSGSSSFTTPRSEALRDYRTALKFDDPDAADKALDRMIELGVDDKDLSASIKRAAPLGPIAKKDRAQFIDELTDDELDTFTKAEEWYTQTFIQ